MHLTPQDQSLESAIGALRTAGEAADLESDPKRAGTLFNLAHQAKGLRRPELQQYLDDRDLERIQRRIRSGR